MSFRELIETRDFQSARAALPIALGKDLEGKPVIADLAKMPHLLIAGATGSGKSVCVNTIITSLVYRHTPKTLRFLMVDPKMVELSVYNTLPHLRHKVITDNRDAAVGAQVGGDGDAGALRAARGERLPQHPGFQQARAGRRRRSSCRSDADVAFEDTTYKGDILPYIVVIIDEMADLMMTVQGEVETPIAMLAQKARAIGIHLILATQRPSVNVITGLIKANFPSRIAFRVASQIDSRTIIDGAGAETLLGNGDMLFIPPGKSEPARLQGAYLSSEDTEQPDEVVPGQRSDAKRAALRRAGARARASRCRSSRTFSRRCATGRSEALEAGGRRRTRTMRATATSCSARRPRWCVQNQQGSTSLLQRRLKVGYGRAARIIDQLQRPGCSARRTAPSRATCSSGSRNWIGSVDRARNVARVALACARGARVLAHGARRAESRADTDGAPRRAAGVGAVRRDEAAAESVRLPRRHSSATRRRRSLGTRTVTVSPTTYAGEFRPG